MTLVVRSASGRESSHADGTIASIGSHYLITLEAIDTRSGASIASENIEAENKEKVLSSMGIAASNCDRRASR